ncbi:MAG: TolC family protein [Bacteroidia bacterium]|nr:TolC family protein [Bacteroidia bacterium]
MHKWFNIRGLVMVLSLLSFSGWAQKLKISECYEKARKNYPLIKQHELIEKSKEYTISNANKAYMPQFSVIGVVGYVFGGLPSVSAPGAAPDDKNNLQLIGVAQLNQTLWDGGATRSHKSIIEASAEMEKASLEVTLYAIKERVNQLYFGILLIEKQRDQLVLLQDIYKKNLEKVKLLKQNGLAYSTDVDELKAELLKTDQRMMEFVYVRKAYLKMLSHLINQELPEETLLEEPESKLQTPTALQRPELTLFNAQRLLDESQSRMERVSLFPKLGLLGAGLGFAPGLSLGPSELNGIALAGINLSWNTAGLYRMKNNSNIRKLNQQKINLQEEQFLFATALQLTQQKTDMDKKAEVLQKDDEIIQLRTRIVKAYELKYENGLCSLHDLILVTDKESEARSQQAMHKVEWLLSQYVYTTTNGN